MDAIISPQIPEQATTKTPTPHTKRTNAIVTSEESDLEGEDEIANQLFDSNSPSPNISQHSDGNLNHPSTTAAASSVVTKSDHDHSTDVISDGNNYTTSRNMTANSDTTCSTSDVDNRPPSTRKHCSFTIENPNNQRSRQDSDSMDLTTGKVKGRGILASETDLQIDLNIFGEGCKFLALVARGDLTNVKLWLKDSPDLLFFRDYDRRTALHVSASEGHLEMLQFFIEECNAGKAINRSDRWGGSPLDDAHRHDHRHIAVYLREHGGRAGTLDDYHNDNQSIHITGLIDACAKGDIEMVRDWIGMGVDVNAGDYDGRTALHLAAGGGHTNVMSELIINGANVNATDRWNCRPLDDAVRFQAEGAIRILSEFDALRGSGSNLKNISNFGGSHGALSARSNNSVDVSDHIGKKLERDNMRIDFTELEILNRIGGGAFGEIFKCQWRGTLVAAKCVKSAKIYRDWAINQRRQQRGETAVADHDNSLSSTTKEIALDDFRTEVSIMKQIRHPNICMLLAYSTTKDYEVMVSELMKCSLLDVFQANIINGTHLSKRVQIVYAQQLAQGMNYLHTCKPPILHRDLKPANLLVDYSGTLKVTDFGLAKVRPTAAKTGNAEGGVGGGVESVLLTDEFVMTGETGSYRFMAPEVFRHERYNESVDVYSYAMIFFNLLSGHQPWPMLNGIKAASAAALEGRRPAIPRDWDTRIVHLLKQCWDEDPSARPKFSRVLADLNVYSHHVFHTGENDVVTAGVSSKCSCAIM